MERHIREGEGLGSRHEGGERRGGWCRGRDVRDGESDEDAHHPPDADARM